MPAQEASRGVKSAEAWARKAPRVALVICGQAVQTFWRQVVSPD